MSIRNTLIKLIDLPVTEYINVLKEARGLLLVLLIVSRKRC